MKCTPLNSNFRDLSDDVDFNENLNDQFTNYPISAN